MRLKFKSITLVALMVLTATPRVFDQLADLKTSAERRFRTELLGIFRSFTTPETQRDEAVRQYSELLARAQVPSPACDKSDEIRTARAARATNSFARSTPPASDLMGHREPSSAEELSAPLPENVIAAVWAEESEKPLDTDEAAPQDKQEDVVLIARNFKDYPVFDEFAAPVAFDGAVAQFEWKQEDEAAALPAAQLPAAQPAAFPKKDLTGTRRITRRFVQKGFQIQLPENLDGVLKDVIINTDALIKANPKCRCRVLRRAPEPPRPLERPALIS